MNRLLLITTFVSIFFIHSVSAGHIVGHSTNTEGFNFPGGVVDLKINKQSSDLPEVRYGLKEPVIIELKDSWRILLGIDLNTLPGEYLVYIKRAIKDSPAFSELFKIRQTPHKLIKKKAVTHNLITLQHEGLSEINFSNTQQPSLPLDYPAQGQWANYFGYIVTSSNNSKNEVQNYISLTTTKLLSITAPQNAIISKIVLNSNSQQFDEDVASSDSVATIYLDHGRGLYSIIAGLTDLSVKAGNGVMAGAVLGKLPSTSGKKNQPHTLIWQCILNGVYVNPIILTQL